MKINTCLVWLAFGLATPFATAQLWWDVGAPLGSGESSLAFCGGFYDTGVPTENLRSYSMSFWLNPTDLSTPSFFLGQTSEGINLGIYQGPDRGPFNRLYQSHWNSDHSGETILSGGGPDDPNSWVHAMFTYDSDSGIAKIFLNGENDGGGSVIDPPNQFGSDNHLILGAVLTTAEFFTGYMDDVAFWDHVVSDDDVAAIASGTLPTEIADPAQLFYDFNEDPFAGDDPSFTSTAPGDGIWDVTADHRFSIPYGPPPPLPPLEFKRPVADGNWNVRMIKISGADSEINDLSEAHAILDFANGGPNTNGWTIDTDLVESRDRIDMARTEYRLPYPCEPHRDGWGHFPHDQRFPDGSGGDSQSNLDEDFLIHSTTEAPFVFPEGTYSIGLRARSGGDLRMIPTDGSEFSFTFEWGDSSPDDTISHDGTGAPWTCGEFTVGAGGLEAHIDSIWVQRGSLNFSNRLSNLDGHEIAIGNGPCETPRFDFVRDVGWVPSAETLSGQGEANSDGANDGVRIAGVPRSLYCDLNGDGGCDLADLDLLYLHDAPLGISPNDIDNWLAYASSGPDAPQLVAGDLDLNGDVDSTDLGLLLNNFGRLSFPSWSAGDLDGNQKVDSTDLGELLNNFGFQSPNVAVVPEPSACGLVMMAFLGLWLRKRRRFSV